MRYHSADAYLYVLDICLIARIWLCQVFCLLTPHDEQPDHASKIWKAVRLQRAPFHAELNAW